MRLVIVFSLASLVLGQGTPSRLFTRESREVATPLTVVYDTGYPSLAMAYAAAGTGVIYITKTWTGLLTSSYLTLETAVRGDVKQAEGWAEGI
jgi:hypothetical protein